MNVDALDGAEVPTSWEDLLKPDYRGMVGYLDPTSAFVGYASAVAVNEAMGAILIISNQLLSIFSSYRRIVQLYLDKLLMPV